MRRDPLLRTFQSRAEAKGPPLSRRSLMSQPPKQTNGRRGENSADPKGKYIPLDVTDTYRMFKDRAQIETAILLKVYHSPIYVP